MQREENLYSHPSLLDAPGNTSSSWILMFGETAPDSLGIEGGKPRRLHGRCLAHSLSVGKNC